MENQSKKKEWFKEFDAQYPAELYTKRPNKNALLSPLYDWTFKQIFTQETEESNLALKSFISAVLERQILKVTVKKNEPVKDSRKQRNILFDVSVEFDDGERSDIEIQSCKENYDYGMRAEILAARLLNNNARRGKKWLAPKVYQISVLNFHYGKTAAGKTDKTEIKWYTMRDRQGNRLTDRQNIIFIDLETIRKKLNTPVSLLTPIEKWGLFFCYVDHDNEAGIVSEIIKEEAGIMAAQKIVKDISKTDDNWFIQNSIWIAKRDALARTETAREEGLQQGLKQGLQQGLKQGLQQGEQKKAVEDAIILIKEFGATPEVAAQKMNASLELVLERLEQKNRASN